MTEAASWLAATPQMAMSLDRGSGDNVKTYLRWSAALGEGIGAYLASSYLSLPRRHDLSPPGRRHTRASHALNYYFRQRTISRYKYLFKRGPDIRRHGISKRGDAAHLLFELASFGMTTLI